MDKFTSEQLELVIWLTKIIKIHLWLSVPTSLGEKIKMIYCPEHRTNYLTKVYSFIDSRGVHRRERRCNGCQMVVS